jgi:hypothetical protein
MINMFSYTFASGRLSMSSSRSVYRVPRPLRPLLLEPLEGLVVPGFLGPLAFDAGSGPTSVAVGDFTGAGIPDLAVADGAGNAVSVLLGNGDGTFQKPVAYSVGSFPVAVAVGNFTGNGNLDIVTANDMGGTVSVLLGNGDGSFQPQQTFAVGPFPSAVAVADFDGDGTLDLAVANSNGTVSVLLGNGDGSFQAPLIIYGVGQPRSLAVGDFDRDGNSDLVVGSVSGMVYVVLGDGDGTFRSPQMVPRGDEFASVAVADVNGDGNPDIVVADGGLAQVYVLLGNGDGSFQPKTPDRTFSVGPFPIRVAVGDFNRDGNPDIVVANGGGNSVSVLLGNGDGFFQAAQNFSAGSYPSSVAVGDFNGDGWPDLVVANNRSNDVSILLNDRLWNSGALAVDPLAAFPRTFALNDHEPVFASLTAQDGQAVVDVSGRHMLPELSPAQSAGAARAARDLAPPARFSRLYAPDVFFARQPDDSLWAGPADWLSAPALDVLSNPTHGLA